MSKRGNHAEVEGLLNLWDLLHLCALEPMTTRDLMARLGHTEASLRRLRRRAAQKFGVNLDVVEVERAGTVLPAFTMKGWTWKESLDARLAALGA